MRTRTTTPSGRPGALDSARDLAQLGPKLAHELKNLLSAAKALVQLGLRNPVERASHARLAVLERELSRMQESLQGYLSSTRSLLQLSTAQVELGPLVAETLRVLSARASGARVRLSFLGDADVECDRRRMGEALVDLVANAIDATPPGGEVEVEVRPSADAVEILVRDTGRGMPPDTLRRIGTPFFTTRDEGTGLGVALARSIIALHGGSLRYESAPGKGTTAIARLPRGASADRSDARRAAEG
jgi:two-component system, NtrC family, sensor histidine kinase HydH